MIDYTDIEITIPWSEIKRNKLQRYLKPLDKKNKF